MDRADHPECARCLVGAGLLGWTRTFADVGIHHSPWKERSMPKVVITHGVADVEKWLGFKAERAAAIGMLGGTDVVDLVAFDGGTTVAVSADVADVDALMATLGSPPPEIAAVMEQHGVLPPVVAFVAG
ncbi:MAG: hypothetical protein ABIV94_00165 [Acidimicrobiales bacterium]